MASKGFSQNGLYSLIVDGRLLSQDWARKTSTIYWEIVVQRPPNPDFWAWSTTNMGNRGRIWDGSSGATLWENKNLAYDFRTSATRWIFASGTRVIRHRANGTAEYSLSGDMNLVNLGSASVSTGWRSLPRLAAIPDAPISRYIDRIAQTSMRYVFQGQGDGGTPIREWQVEWGVSGSNKFALQWSNGTFEPGNLLPGTLYAFRARGRNDVGWGGWSSWMRARTNAGVRVKVNGVWREAIPYVKRGNVWRPATTLIKNGSSWKQTT